MKKDRGRRVVSLQKMENPTPVTVAPSLTWGNLRLIVSECWC